MGKARHFQFGAQFDNGGAGIVDYPGVDGSGSRMSIVDSVQDRDTGAMKD